MEQLVNPFCEWCTPEADKMLREIERLNKQLFAAQQAVLTEGLTAEQLRESLEAKNQQLIRYVRQYGPEPSPESRCPECDGTGKRVTVSATEQQK